MRLDAFRLGIAFGSVAAALWTIGSVGAAVMPAVLAPLRALVADAYANHHWIVWIILFIFGLIASTLGVGLSVATAALIYNRLDAADD